jgi:hypothetical protein
MIKVDMFFGHRRKRQQHRNNKHHGPRYYIRHIKRNSSRVRWRRSHNRLCIFHTFASLPKTTNKDKKLYKDAHQVHFDSDSFIIGIDNHASRSISNNIDHFTTALRSPKNAFIQGVGGELLTVKGEGTLVWHIEDDEGRAHRITIKDSLFVPKAPICLLLPQHWAQSVDNIHPKPHGTWCADYHDCLVLHWDQEHFHRTIPWDRRTNVARLRSAAGTVKYRTFTATFDIGNEMVVHEHVVFAAPHLIRNDEEDEDLSRDIATDSIQTIFEPTTTTKQSEQPISQSDTIQQTREENLSDFLTEVPPQSTPNVIEDDEGRLAGESNQADILRWHYRLGHLSFAKIKLLALLRILPRKLAAVKPPKCAGCLYGSMMKRPWQTKSAQNKGRLRTVQVPGECISVDQLESPLPGFVAQLKGKLTRKRYNAATVLVDHKSQLSYVHLQEGLTSKETVKAKHAFEAYAWVFGINTIRHYHADNGRFADNAFLKDVTASGQTISFCGVNAHFQNGIAEKMIRDLQESTRKQLLHAKSRWPKAIEINLWPYALRLANHLRNSLPDRDDATSPIERFSRVQVAPHLRENHPFGCPVYALNNRLQSGNRIPKWDSRARLGVYFGPSPRHASSVSLVLRLETGLVSPQFHVRNDDFF